MWDEAKRQAALAACNAWQAELERLFGKRAGDVRYTLEGKGSDGSELRRLHDVFAETSAAWARFDWSLAPYCLGHDWFEDGKAPYPVYSVATRELVAA